MNLTRKRIFIYTIIGIIILVLSAFAVIRIKKYIWIQKGLRSQAESEEWYAKTWNEIYSKYPWLDEANLFNDKYIVSFDRERERFIGATYGKNNIQTKRQEAISVLRERGVPVDKYPFEWEIDENERVLLP